MNFTIRNIEERDYTALIELFLEFAHFEKEPDKMTNSVEQMLAEKEHIMGFVVENNSKEIIGYTTCFFAYHTWIGKSLYMDDLYVKPAYRGKGLGTKLISKIIDYAKSENCKKLKWQVSDWNTPAAEFYKSIGAKISTVQNNCDLVF